MMVYFRLLQQNLSSRAWSDHFYRGKSSRSLETNARRLTAEIPPPCSRHGFHDVSSLYVAAWFLACRLQSVSFPLKALLAVTARPSTRPSPCHPWCHFMTPTRGCNSLVYLSDSSFLVHQDVNSTGPGTILLTTWQSRAQ